MRARIRLGMAATSVLLPLVVAGCGSGGTDMATGDAVAPQEAEPSKALAEPQSCQTLIDSGWRPPATDPSVVLDPDTGIAEVSFDADTRLVVDVVNDPACANLPGIGQVLASSMTTYEQGRLQECTSAVEDVIDGVVPRKGEIVGSLDALRRHVLEWCPPQFAERLLTAERADSSG